VGAGSFPVSAAVAARLETEHLAGLDRVTTFAACRTSADEIRRAVRAYLEEARRRGRSVVGYGAPSRATTLLAASGVTADLLPFTVDRSVGKHGSFLPGSAIPIREPAELLRTRPDDVFVLTWDLAHEVVAQLPEVLGWGGRFVAPIPRLHVVAGPPLIGLP
jgi:hypothetical protein